MTLRKLYLLALLVTSTTALINCSGKYSCYAESSECDPNTECHTVLHFDPSGNVDIYVRNVSNTDYISIVTDRDVFNTMEYFVCVPFAGQRLRGLGRTGQTVLFNQQNRTKVVQRLDQNYFQCIISAKELEPDFRQNGNFIVARGTFQQFLKVNEGVKLYKVEQEESNNIENDLKTEHFIPTVYNIAAPVAKVDTSSYLWKEDPEASKILRKLENFLFNHAENWKALEIVEDLNTQVNMKALKKQRHQNRNKSQSHSNTHRASTYTEEDEVPKNKRVHGKHNLVSVKNNLMSKGQNSSATRAIKKKQELKLDEDLNEKIYVRMTKQQMYSFVDEQEKSEKKPKYFDAPKNFNDSDQKQSTMDKRNGDIVANDDVDEEVYVLMTKGQMYTFVDKQAERQVSDPKTIYNQRNDSNRQLYTMLFLLIAVFYPFWCLFVQLL